VEENAANGGFVLLATADGEACAYAFCEERADEVELVELAYTRLAAVDALLAAIKPIGKDVWWTVPEGDRFLMLRCAWKDRVRLQPHVMFRVVGVPLAFAQAAPACHGELLLEVSGDTMVPANNGVFRIVSLGGAAQAIRTDGQPQFSCSIGSLAQVLTGHMDAAEALDAGMAQGDAAASELLCRMYPKQHNFLFELY
jgi:predicted acetyltransferase